MNRDATNLNRTLASLQDANSSSTRRPVLSLRSNTGYWLELLRSRSKVSLTPSAQSVPCWI